MITEDPNKPDTERSDISTQKEKEPKQSIYLQKSNEDPEV